MENVMGEASRLARQFMKRFTRGSLAMFCFALACELPVILARVFVVVVINLIVNLASGQPDAGPKWWWVGLLPSFWAASALLAPIGSGWWWRQRIGGRSPSQREQLAYEDAIALLRSQAPEPLALPAMWFVIDANVPDAAVNGDALMLSRGLLESDHLPAVLAHELGHLATPDGRLTAALNRLVIPKAYEFDRHRLQYLLSKADEQDAHAGIDIHAMLLAGSLKLAMFATGGFGLWLTRPFWGRYWRRREYAADAYAATLGQAEDLAEFLEAHALIHDHPVPYIWLTEHTHPPVELRIDKLLNREEDQPAPPSPRPAPYAPGSEGDRIAARSEPVKGTPSGSPTAGLRPPLTEP